MHCECCRQTVLYSVVANPAPNPFLPPASVSECGGSRADFAKAELSPARARRAATCPPKREARRRKQPTCRRMGGLRQPTRLNNNQTGNQRISQWFPFFGLQTNHLQLGHAQNFSATNRAARWRQRNDVRALEMAALILIRKFFIKDSAEHLGFRPKKIKEIKIIKRRIVAPAPARKTNAQLHLPLAGRSKRRRRFRWGSRCGDRFPQ